MILSTKDALNQVADVLANDMLREGDPDGERLALALKKKRLGPPVERFRHFDPDDEVCLDIETGLYWQIRPLLSGVPWNQAYKFSKHLTICGTKGWRLPTIIELQQLWEAHKFIASEHHGIYWSSTTKHSNRYVAVLPFGIRLEDGKVSYYTKNMNNVNAFKVRCVHD